MAGGKTFCSALLSSFPISSVTSAKIWYFENSRDSNNYLVLVYLVNRTFYESLILAHLQGLVLQIILPKFLVCTSTFIGDIFTNMQNTLWPMSYYTKIRSACLERNGASITIFSHG